MNNSDHNPAIITVRKTVIAKLLKGKKMATKLQNLIDEPVVPDREAIDFEDLAHQIFRSFADSLQMITALTDSTPISAAESSKKPAVKNRRGCYKRRRSSDSWVILSAIEEDGHAWRKYGQKDIMNSIFPRGYYRCTHKPQGCKALKQVQKIEEGPTLYQITYFNHHTCTHQHPERASSLLLAEQSTSHLISFQSDGGGGGGAATPNDDQTILTIDYTTSGRPFIKEEEEDQQEESSDAKSSVLLDDTWREIMESECYNPINWDEGASCGSSSFDGLGIEINGQFPDVEAFLFDDHVI